MYDGLIKNVTSQSATFAGLPEKFEGGTQNVSGAVGLAAAIGYIEKIGIESILAWENKLKDYALNKLNGIEGIEIYHPTEESVPVISFNLKGVHPHDVASMLDEERIAIRAGHNCAIPLMKRLGLRGGVSRISFSFYNTFQDVDKLIKTLKEIQRRFA